MGLVNALEGLTQIAGTASIVETVSAVLFLVVQAVQPAQFAPKLKIPTNRIPELERHLHIQLGRPFVLFAERRVGVDILETRSECIDVCQLGDLGRRGILIDRAGEGGAFLREGPDEVLRIIGLRTGSGNGGVELERIEILLPTQRTGEDVGRTLALLRIVVVPIVVYAVVVDPVEVVTREFVVETIGGDLTTVASL